MDSVARFGPNSAGLLQDHHTPGLLHDYKSIMGTYGLPNLTVKEMLVREFGCDIGFHGFQRKNVAYNTSGSSLYIEAVLSLLGIDNDQLVQNVASMLRDERTSLAPTG